ncbi:MAG: ABC transporter ATP-binding protein [Hyphomicrobium sp.]
MLVEIKNLKKIFSTGTQNVLVLKGINLSLKVGETHSLTGESGSGKSTLLHLVAGLDQPDEGSIIFEGQDLTTLSDQELARIRRTRIGIVFQNFNLISSLNVMSNLAFQARLAGNFDEAFLKYLAEKLLLEDCLHRYPEQLSGGQQQRVAIGRALAVRPRLLLADEPTGNLDEKTAHEILQLMLSMVSETKTTLFMVTHSKHVAGYLSRHFHLHNGELLCYE